MAKPHSHSTSWRYACHRPINDTTPAIRPSESHNPNRPTNRPTNCASGSILCRSASNERNVPVVHRSSQRDRGAFPPFRPNGYSERIIARLYIRIIITHAPIPSSPPDRLLFRSTEPADLQRSPRPRAGRATPRNVLSDALVPGPLFRLFGHAKVQSEGFRFCNLILFFHRCCIASLKWRCEATTTRVARRQFEIAKQTGFMSYDQSKEHMTVAQPGTSRRQPNW